MFPLSQPSQSPHIILRYNVVDWYSATVNVVHLDQGAQGLPSGPQGLIFKFWELLAMLRVLGHLSGHSDSWIVGFSPPIVGGAVRGCRSHVKDWKLYTLVVIYQLCPCPGGFLCPCGDDVSYPLPLTEHSSFFE